MSVIEQAPQSIEQKIAPPGQEEVLTALQNVESSLAPKEIIDEQGFARNEFQLEPGVTLIVRGREELPTFEDEDTKVSYVIGAQERPVHTSGDDFGAWIDQETEGNPIADPFERGAESDKGVRLIASASPVGILHLAEFLSEKMGKGEAGAVDKIREVREAMEKGQVNESVLDYLDQYFAACAFHEVGDHNELIPGEQGVLELAAALTGDTDAQRLIELKQGFVAQQDADRREKSKHLRVEPGSPLTPEQLEAIKEKHLVAVHTTPARPNKVDEGAEKSPLVISPASGFGDVNSPDYFPRSSIHWSLNHSVESHMMGNFESRGYTIVAPVEGLAQFNGSPASVYGVDTYFVIGPGEGMILPESTTVIDTTAKEQEHFIEQNGSFISIDQEKLSKGGLEQLTEFIVETYPELFEGSNGKGSVPDKETVRAFALREIAYGGEFGAIAQDREARTTEPSIYDDPVRTEWLKRARATLSLVQNNNPDTDVTASRQEFREAVQRTLEKCLADESILENSPEMQPFIVESIRKMLVNLSIRSQGGQIVSASGGHYIETEGFDESAIEVARITGANTGLHVDNPEAELENEYGAAVARAQKHDRSEANPSDFDWTKFNSESVWHGLTQVSTQERRAFVRTGMLTFAQKPELITSLNSGGSLW